MSRSTVVRGAFAVLAVLICGPLFATAYTSAQSGDWGVATTWSPNGVPTAGDTVDITGSHLITVSDTQQVDSITFQNNSGNKELHIVSTGNLTVLGTGTSVNVNPSTDGANLLLIDGGVMSVPNGSISVGASGLGLARVRFTTNSGTLSIGDDVLFAGNPVNAQVNWDVSSAGTLEIGGDLAAGGTLNTSGSSSTVEFNGPSSQTINPYTFQNLTIDKSGTTATLNGAITINGNLAIPNGVLDDGGFQISLDSGATSQVNIGANGVLKLGSEFVATTFPFPYSIANVTLNSGSAVVYQSNAGQSIDDSIDYQRLFLQKIGALNAFKSIAGSALKVIQELYVDANVTVDFDNDTLDVDGNINGNGTIQLSNTVVPGTMTVGGNWSGGTLVAVPGTTVTYDGTAAQVMRGATYQNLVINNTGGDVTLDSGSATVNQSLALTSGNVVISGTSFTIDVLATVTRTSGHFIGPLTMGLNPAPARRFEVGTATSYMPVDVDAGSPGTITIKALEGAHPNNTGPNTLDRYWNIGSPFTVTNVDSLQFNYNQSDFTFGDETKFRLARHDGANWSDHGDVAEATNTVITGALSPYSGDYVIGQKGSTGFAGKVAVTSVNGGVDPTVNTPFDVDVETQHDDGSAANVTSNSTIDVLLAVGSGSLLTSTASVNGGTSTGTATGLSYDTVESNIQVVATSSSGDLLDSGTSAPFNVVALPSTLVVTNTNDSGAGSLRDAITTYNSSGCAIPCTITFASTGTGNIVLASQLPALTGGQLTIDGFTGLGAQPNTNSFSQPLNSVITVSLDGNNLVPFGLIIQSANTTIKGLGFRNFNFGGTGEAIKIDGVSGCSIAGNYIGTNNGGTTATPNYFGVVVNGAGATGNIIGGNNPADRNLISGNVLNGIVISNADANEISNNFIGTAVDGTSPLGNGGHGVSLTGSTAMTKIGFQQNRIAFNTLKGVEVNTTGIANLIRTNEIYSNTGIAIDLGTDGPTVNTPGDADTGANNLQNYPDISSAQVNGANVDVTLSLDSSLGVNANFFVIDIFKADSSTPSQAAEYLGSSGCLAGVLTNQIVSVPVGSLTVGGKVVATATAYGGAACTGVSEGTSELSPGFTVNGNVYWINAAGGAWENAANWDTGFLPGPGDNAIIDLVGTYTVTLSSGQTVQSLTLGNGISGAQTLQINTGPLTLNAASSITTTGALILNSNIQGTGTLTNNGTFTWNTGVISLAGLTNNSPNMTLATASAKALVGTTLTNGAGGTIVWSGGVINMGTGGAISNAGLFDTNFDGTFNNSGSGGAFTNTGTFRKSGGAASTLFSTIDFNHNGGQLEVQQGAVDLAGGSAGAAINISASRKLIINSDTYIFGASTTLTGTGKVEVTGGTLTVNAAVNFPALHVIGGLVDGSGNIIAGLGQQIVWDGGTFGTGGGQVQILTSGTLQIATASAKSLTRTLDISGGSAFWSGGTINIGTGGSITNSGLFETTTDATLNNSGVGVALFTNTGTFKKSGGAGSTFFSNVDLSSSNILWVATGTVDLANATLSGSVDLDAGTVLLVNSDTVTLTAPTFPDTGLLHITGGTLTMNGGFSLTNVQFDNGTMNGSGAVTHSGPFLWNSGTLSGTGTTSIGAGGSLSLASGSAKALDRALSIQSGQTATWSGGTINVGTNGSITNAGTFDITADNNISKSGGGTPTLTNTGTLRKSGAAGMTTFINVDINSSSTVEVLSGTLNPANMSISGTVDLNPGTTLRIDSDTVTINGVTTFPDSGTVEVQGGTLMVSNNVSIPTFIFNSGTIDGAATLILGNTATWGGGTMQGSGVTEIPGGATLTMNGVVKILNARTLRPLASSNVNWTAGTLSMTNGGNIDNTGLFHVSFDGNLNNSGTAGGFLNNNLGTLRKSTTTGSLTLTGINLTNNGILDIDLGKVDVTGNYVQGATGSLDILLGGVVAGTQHGQLVTNNNPSLAGALNVTFNGPYQPLVNDNFTIIAWPSDAHTGNFITPYNLPALANSRTWSSAFTATGLHLLVNAGNADLSMTKTSSLANVAAGNPISYTLTVNNIGPDSANSVTVTDTLPAGHTAISASGTGWTCNVAGDTVTCTVASLPVGTAPVITINANAPITPQSMNNTATVTSTNPDPANGDNSSNVVVTVDPPSADIDLSATAPGGPVAQNTAFQFTFAVTNNGPQSATNVSFSAPIPPELSYVLATPDTGTCNFAANTITCSLGTITSGNAVNVLVDLTTTSTAGTHTVTGSGSATETDPLPTNNTVTPAVQVIGASVAVTNTNDSGTGSLRQALLDAQSAVCTSPCVITFNIPGAAPFVISPTTDFPAIGNDVTIDGSSQPGFTTPIVQINGGLLNTSPGTFVMSGTGSTIRGLSITGSNGTSPAVRITGSNNAVVQNFIGVDTTQAAAPNAFGVAISGSNNKVGGSVISDANAIAHNTNDGVIVTGSGIGNSILNNNIHDNGLLGIDLADDGPTPNIAGDADTGPNNLQNSPTITSAVLDGSGNMTINSNIDSSSTSAASILFEFFEADAAGEGATFVASACTAGNAFGLGTTFPVPGFIAAGDSIVGTATAYSDAGCGTVADGTSEFSNVVVVTLCTAPPATLNTPPSVCANATNVAASVNAPTATSFNWSATNATIVSGQGTNAITFNAAATGSVVLSVTVEDTNGCTNTVNNTFPITPTPVVNIAGPTATCAGTPVTLDAGNFAFYSWSTGATTQTITVSPTTATTYSVTVTDANGCTATDSHTVTVSATPAATITTPVSVCANGNGNANVTSQAGATYAWTITNGTLTSAANAASITFTAGASGNVGLAVTVTVGSCTSNGNVNVPITAAPVVNITGPTAVCANTPFTLDAGSGFSSYSWSTGATSQTITISQSAATQTYNVTVSNGACSSTDTHTVTASGPNATITAPLSANEGQTGLSASVPLQAGATYLWSIDNGTITAGQGTNAITFDAGDAGAGATTLTVQVTNAGCTANGSHAVNINGNEPATADVSITKTAPASAQTGGTIVYTISVHNAGPASLSNINISDPLPAGTSLVSFNDGTLDCALLGNTIVCGGSLNAGATKNVSITVNAPSQPGTIVNTATVSGGIDDPIGSNNSASASTTVTSPNTNCATTPPSLLSPLAGAEVDSPVTFSWTAVAGATEYELWIVNTTTTLLAGTTNATSLTVPLPSGAASWYVVARLGNCDPLTSQQRAFTVRIANGCATHGVPQLTAPAMNSTVTSPVTFSWMPVPQAIGYRVWIEVNGTAAQDIGTTDGAITLSADVPPGSINAFVTALFNGCPDTQSPKIAFTVPRPDPCADRVPVTLLAPANNSVVNTSLVTFNWSDANADGYRLWIAVNGAPAEVAGTTTELSMQTTIDNGSVEWFVENLYDGCGSIDSQHFNFTIPPRQNCATTAPQLIAPANGVLTNGNVTFQWSAVPNAVAYELWLSAAGATPTLIGTTSATSFTHLVPAGALQWFVRAIVDRCPSVDSQTGHIVFNPSDACRENQPPHAIAPLPNADVTSPVSFEWSARPNATSYDLFIIRGDDAPQLIVSTTNTLANDVALQTGKLRWFVRANAGNCSPLDSAERPLEVVQLPQGCAELVPPRITMPGQISSGVPFDIQWDAIPGANAYQLQLASDAAFTNAQLVSTLEPQHTLTRVNNGTTPLAVYARVRALDTSCQPEPTITPYGASAAVFILPSVGVDGAAPVNGGTVTHTIVLGPELAGQSFIVHIKEPWLSVQPSSGVVAAGGTTLTVTADTTNLPLGTSLGSVQIELTSPARGGISTEGTTIKIPTMTISKVTPVTPAPKSTPPPDALIIPAVAHATGINSLFQSDVRVSNTSAQQLQYQATFTPTGSEGLAAGRQTTFSVDAGRTIALDDVLKGWFGTGGDSVTGTLEIRPLTQTETSTSNLPLSGLANIVTFASSRTFNVTSNGTFGQYIPAIPFANFIGGATESVPASVLSLQQIAQSDRYRTNLGIVEGSGDAASLMVKVFGSNGQMLKEFPVNLAGGQHTQLNSFLSSEVGSLTDGRVEIAVVGGSGKVTAYASVLDNKTSDPLLVTPVTLTDAGNTKWVVPGVADLNSGNANWQTDMRLFNAGTTDVDATLSFYSQNGGAPAVANVTIPAGQIRQFDKALASVFGLTNNGGAIHVATSAPTRLVATARTYNQTTTGTYGQFISGVTPGEAAGVGSRPLQILQVEESNRFRSNIGLAEVTGNPVTLAITVVPPDGKLTATIEVPMQPNEFRQIGSLLRSVGLSDTYNSRVTVRVISGTGRITAYASVIDMLTNDPTYIPAQ